MALIAGLQLEARHPLRSGPFNRMACALRSKQSRNELRALMLRQGHCGLAILRYQVQDRWRALSAVGEEYSCLECSFVGAQRRRCQLELRTATREGRLCLRHIRDRGFRNILAATRCSGRNFQRSDVLLVNAKNSAILANIYIRRHRSEHHLLLDIAGGFALRPCICRGLADRTQVRPPSKMGCESMTE